MKKILLHGMGSHLKARSVRQVISLLVVLSMAGVEAQYNPCYDEIYLDLKAQGITNMTSREYHYFSRKDEECSEYNTFDKQYRDQLDIMQDNLFKLAEKVELMGKDIDLDNVYGMGRLNATDPELRSLSIIRSRDDDIQREFNTLSEKLILMRKEIQSELEERGQGLADLVVNSITVIDSVDGGYIKTVNKEGRSMVLIGKHPSGSGSLVTYNIKGRPAVRVGSNGEVGGYVEAKGNTGKRAAFIGTEKGGSNMVSAHNPNGETVFISGSNGNDHGYIKTLSSGGNNATILGAKKDGSGYISTYGSSGKRTSLISADGSVDGVLSLYDRDQKLQWNQKAKPVPKTSQNNGNVQGNEKKKGE